MPKQRLDALLVERSLAASRQQAQRLIQAGEVRVNGEVVDKAGTPIAVDATIVVATKPRYVSRGGDKLAKALAVFPVTVQDRIALDGGISTGGFTDCLLQAGAQQVYGVDVGYGQVDWKLRTDPRLILKERVNLRYLTPPELYGDRPPETYADLGVVDVSFISLSKVLPALWSLLQPPRDLITLIKPQFEVGRDRVGKKGVVRSSADQADAIEAVIHSAHSLGWHLQGLTWSPLTGPSGNVEYLAWFSAGFPPLAHQDDRQDDRESRPQKTWERSDILALTAAAQTALNSH
jgi:23S rRNA (cytidine1920-2'-O)/16S rRNA (cytidine1409-2'-O)-methyltransferase